MTPLQHDMTTLPSLDVRIAGAHNETKPVGKQGSCSTTIVHKEVKQRYAEFCTSNFSGQDPFLL